MSEGIEFLVALAMAWILSGYCWRTLKSGEAIGLFFDFARAREPVRYWAYSLILAVVAAGQIVVAARRLAGLLF